ncbi:hypothetical protein [Demequina oxidasica]|uniref:hypothetical protein n=1 Tax=Demequina oxidasica TaxID=676199 RepID=UPI0007847C0C|nr:hypothetical protein [Demequina oxidasica]
MAGRTLNFAITADAKDFSKAVGGAKGDLGNLGTEADKASRKIDGIGDSVAENADTVASKGSQIGGALSGIGDVLSNSTNPALKTMGASMVGVGAGIQFLADSGDLVNGVVETFKNFEIVQKAQSLATKVATGVQAAFNAVMAANPIALIVLAVAALVAGLVLFFTKTEAGQKIWQAFTDFLGTAVDKIKTFFTETIPTAFQKVSDKATEVKDWIVTKFTAAVDWLKGLPGRIVTAVGDLFGTIKDKAVAAKDWVVEKFLALVTWYVSLPGRIARAVGDLFSAVKDKAVAAKDWVTDKFQSVIDWFKKAPSKIASAASGMWDGVGDAFKGTINKVIGWWNNFSVSLTVPSNALTNAIGIGGKGFTINTPNIPYLANGGITSGPTLAMIGDNPGGREAVIPLDKYDLGGGITREDLKEFARVIVEGIVNGYDKSVDDMVRGFENGTVRQINRATAHQNMRVAATYGVRGR